MDDFLTVAQVAALKGVSLKAVYKAVSEGRLSSTRILGRLGLKKTDVDLWTPRVHSVRRKSQPVSDETKRRISQAQKLRWAALLSPSSDQIKKSTRSSKGTSPPTSTDES